MFAFLIYLNIELLVFRTYCNTNKMKPLSTADFGKVMKQVFPHVRPRRLGTRGNSRYCYAGMCKRMKLETPVLPDIGDYVKVCSIFHLGILYYNKLQFIIM